MRVRFALPVLFVALVALVGACGGSAPTGLATFGAPSVATSEPSAPLASAPVATALETPVVSSGPTAAPETATPESAGPIASLAPIRIDEVECLTGLTVRLHLHAKVDTTIDGYEVWSTWGGGGRITETFSAPLPSEIDKVVEFTHDIVDPEATRIHEFGLAVTTTGVADPIIVYALEPHFRCTGH